MLPKEHINRMLQQLQRRYTSSDLKATMLPHHGYPSAEQWLILLCYAPAEAEEMIERLRQQARRIDYARAPTSMITSLIAYEAAMRYQSSLEPVAPTPIVYLKYPTQTEWLDLLQDNQAQALDLYRRIQLQSAFLGIEALGIIEESLVAFQKAYQR